MRRISFLLLLVLFVGCDGVGKTSTNEYITKAQESLDKGDLSVALINLKNAIVENPDNSHARWLLGKLYLDVGNGASADKELRRAHELGIVDEAVIPLIARALLQQEKYKEVLELGTGSSLSNEAAAELLTSRGLAYLLLGENDKAQTELDRALEKNPNSPYALVERARLSVSKRNFEEARPYIDMALEIDPNYPFAWSLLGDMNRLENNIDTAIEDYTKAIDNSYNTRRDLLERAMLLIKKKQYDKAQYDINELKNLAPDHPKVDFAQGLAYLRQGKILEAQESFDLCLRKDPNDTLALYYLGITHFIKGNIEQADSNLSSFLNTYPDSVNGRKLLALVKIRERDFITAEKLISPVVKEISDDVFALNILADAMFYQGKIDELLSILGKTSTLQPDSASARTRMGIGLLLHGDEEESIENLESAVEIDPQFQNADLLLILSYLHTKSYDKAKQIADAFSEKHPASALAQNLIGKVYLAQGRENLAEEAFEKARKLAPGDPFACRNLAILALRRSETNKARALFNEVLDHNPGHLPTLYLLAALEERDGDYEAMKTTLHQAIELAPNAVTPRVLLAQRFLKEGEPEQVFTLLDQTIRTRQRNNPVVIGLLCAAELDTHAFQNAKITCEHLVELQPNSPQAHFLLAKAYGGLSASDKLKTELQKTLMLAPGHLQASIALTRAWLLDGDLAKAKAQLTKLKTKAPNMVDVLVLEGEILSKSGESDKALAVYQTLFAAKPDTENLLRLTKIQWDMGDHNASLKQLESWITEHSDDVPARQALASTYIKLNQQADATAQFEELLKIAGDNPIVLNDMAWHLRESNPDRALQLAKKAYSIAPQSVSIMDTLAFILIKQGDMTSAQNIIQKALDMAPESPTLIFRRAMLLDATGKSDEAIAELTRLLKKNRAFPEQTEAESMLARLKNSYN
jgi:putative PEP-CTERM system TPR-repeat lipoprotein